MSRLLFASARGARIETRYTYHDTFKRRGAWRTAASVTLDPDSAAYPHEQRIHPDDEHLQYGPISTALRESAETTVMVLNYSVHNLMAIGAVCEYTEATRSVDWVRCASERQRSLFLLILAEALADEGL